MEYNWSWLPPQRRTTPPPNGPSSGDLEDVEVLEEGSGRDGQEAIPRHFIRHFAHNNQENGGAVEFFPVPLGTFDSSEGDDDNDDNMMDDSDVDTETIASGVDFDDDVEDENDEDADITGDEDGDTGVDDPGQEDEPPFDPASVGLKEISNLASFTVSSYKPGCGVKELRDDDAHLFWQSDGPQPHRLNIHFIKRVEIRALRLYLDYELDESYTPTKIQITAGFGPNLTIPFTTMELAMPKGWIDVPIAGAGGGADGNSLCCWFVRVIILENHQNGKDTHLRGIKVYALDDNADTAENNALEDIVDAIDYYDEGERRKTAASSQDRIVPIRAYTPGDGGLSIPDFMREPEIR